MGRSIRYIGSKTRIAEAIISLMRTPSKKGRLVDVFSGSGATSREAVIRGIPVLANDHLNCAVFLTAARLTGTEDVNFDKLGGYDQAIKHLNLVNPKAGYITRSYSPESVYHDGLERRYFSVNNAMKIDAVRAQIRGWESSGLIRPSEQVVLIADLLESTNAVANIAGTYGCFLKTWSPTSLARFDLTPRKLLPGSTAFDVSIEDAFAVKTSEHDVVYLDPPYTKRQYASYYHILETITLGDEPSISGVCGLRPWKHLASPFCYKRRARAAFVELIQGFEASEIYVSYSNQGQVPLDELVPALQTMGSVNVTDLGRFGRYRPNVTAMVNGSEVVEYLIHVSKN